jgi:hypothetical protein
MSRSFSARSLTTSPPIRTSPCEMSSSPATTRSGRLPGAGRADEDHQLAVADVEVEVLDGLEPVGVPPVDIVELDLGHPGKCRPGSCRRDTVRRSGDPRSERASAEPIGARRIALIVCRRSPHSEAGAFCSKNGPGLRGLPCAEGESNLHPVKPGPGRSPGSSGVRCVQGTPDRPYRPRFWTIRTHRTEWKMSRAMSRVEACRAPGRHPALNRTARTLRGRAAARNVLRIRCPRAAGAQPPRGRARLPQAAWSRRSRAPSRPRRR